MRARVIETGEIVDVKLDLSKRCCGIDGISPFSNSFYLTFDGNKSYMGYELDFNFKAVDWEQRRWEAAKVAMQGILSNTECLNADNVIEYEDDYAKKVARSAIHYADALINELKGE